MTASSEHGREPGEQLLAFVNTLDVDHDRDALDSPAALALWLREQGLLARRTPASEEDLALALRLRNGLREVWSAHHDGREAESADLDAASSELPLRMSCCGPGPTLEPVDPGVRGALGRLLVAVNETVIDGDWPRLKLCGDDTCRWAYYDATKNRSKNWCGEGCSNRAKTRSYRARRRAR